MTRTFIAALAAVVMLALPLADAEAKRLGGGTSSGVKRSTPPPTQDTAAKPAAQPGAATPAPAPAPAPAAAAAPKRSWLGPVAGLAAGLGIAALASHFGLGGELANVMTMLLVGGALALLVGFLIRRFAAARQPAGDLSMAGANAGAGMATAGSFDRGVPGTPQLQPISAVPASAGADPFDSSGFASLAKRVFIRLQAANDAGDQADLRRFTTPEMYAVVQQQLLDRPAGGQRTEIVQLDAAVVDRAQANGEQVVSVRFSGLLREEASSPAAAFDEVWHLVRPLDESREWAIAGIQQTA